jgi:hypothetical protein
LILMHSSFATLDSRSMNLLLACHPIFHSDDWGYQRERAVGLLVSSAGAQAAGQRSSPRTLAVHSRSFFYKKCQRVLVPGLVSFLFIGAIKCTTSALNKV